MYNALKESDWESTSSSESESMEAILRSFGYNEDQVKVEKYDNYRYEMLFSIVILLKKQLYTSQQL